MKQIILRTLILAAISISGSTIGYAQLTQSYKAQIPFDFAVKDAQMKAGEYQIRPVLSGSGLGVLQLIDVDHHRMRILGTIGQSDYTWDGNAGNKLRFVEDNGRYTLASVETQTFQKSMGIVTASAQVIARNAGRPTDVWVALN